jgi:cytochrome P450
MLKRISKAMATVPGWERLVQLPRQVLRINPFDGDVIPTRVRLFQPRSGRPALPFPHPWNYQEPIRILGTYYWGSENDQTAGRHNRYLDFPGFPPVLVTRDPGIIRAILTGTGDRDGEFERDTLPSTGIARATGKDTLLFSNGPFWRRQRKISAASFGKTSLFQVEKFEEFAETARATIHNRLAVLRQHLEENQKTRARVQVESEVKPLMLEMLVNCFFGADVDYDRIRNDFVPAFERVIDHIVRDTVSNRLGVPVSFRACFSRRYRKVQADFARMEELTDLVVAARHSGTGLWAKFKSDAPDEVLRSNLKVFLAGALEATTSYATWAISHLARNLPAQDRVFQEVRTIEDYSPENLAQASFLGRVLDETLRLTPSLYFLPRRATAATWVTAADGRRMFIPSGTHILLDVWHANRHEDHWGTEVSGFPATEFAPERWEYLASQNRQSKDMLHFGFGHGARVCPGKHLGQLEVALIVGAFVKLFRFEAVNAENDVRAGVSTKPRDGTLVDLELRE